MAESSGVRIVAVEQGESDRSWYQLNMELLELMLQHPDVADRRVAVVSVAGACRGGKSFMLDYFLRYLSANMRARADGSWLGAPDEPLRGFTWRGGVERETTGILLWSRPLLATSSTGEPVAVLLMDTQGTFDTQTTTRDSTTIFALSTLLSSVQIYNIHRDIREDDLQHLHMFTAHGMMALELINRRRPYQTLKFLIRDWISDEEIPYGAEGGRALLDRRLQVNNGSGELQEVRDHIHACFSTVDCFLMPHPGLPVHRENFDGRHSGVTEDFRQQLLAFVPSVFESRNLPVKMINGAQVTCRELLTYIRTYVDLFNSGDMPEPMSIMRANTEAALVTAMEACRRQYAEEMDRICGVGGKSHPPAVVRALHSAARDAALETFRTRITMATMANEQALQQCEAELAQELERRLQEFEMINEAKYYNALADAKKMYEEVIKKATENNPLCLNPPDLQELHRQAVVAALGIFDSKRMAHEGVHDDERAVFCMVLDNRLTELNSLNEQNNNAAIVEGKDSYITYMDSMCGDPPCMRVNDLQFRHQEALEMAIGIFMSKRNQPTEHQRDIYESILRKDIEEKFTKLLNVNVNSNNAAVQAAITSYNNYMGSVCASHLPCVAQEYLNQKHEEAIEMALNEFHSKRRPGEDVDDTDDYRVRVIQELTRRYQELCELNEVAAGLAAYCNAMESTCGVGRPRLSANALAAAHDYAVNLAMQIYQQYRLGRLHGNNSNDERQRQTLAEKIDERFVQCQAVNTRNAETVGDVQGGEPANVSETAMVATGAALVAGAVVGLAGAGLAALTVATGGTALPAILTAIGSSVTAESVATAAVAAAGVAGTAVAATWQFVRNFRRR